MAQEPGRGGETEERKATWKRVLHRGDVFADAGVRGQSSGGPGGMVKGFARNVARAG